MTAPRAGGSATPSSSPAPGCPATAESSHLSACHLARQVPTSADFIRRISLTSPDAERSGVIPTTYGHVMSRDIPDTPPPI
jgi:hypothetical protein